MFFYRFSIRCLFLGAMLFFCPIFSGFSQTRLDSIKVEVKHDQSLVEFIAVMEKQYRLRFFYQKDWLSPFVVTTDLDGLSLQEVLQGAVEGSTISFKLMNGYQVLFLKDQVINYKLVQKIEATKGRPPGSSNLVSPMNQDASVKVNKGEDNFIPEGKMTDYISLETNLLLQQFLNLGGENNPTNNPFVLNWSENSNRTGAGFNIGLGFSANSISENSNGNLRTTTTNSTSYRVGYDHKYFLGKKVIAATGVDIFRLRGKSVTKVNQSGFFSNIQTSSKGGGFGVRFNLNYVLHPNILIGTEANLYYQTKTDIDSISLTGGPGSSVPLKSRKFELQLPVSVYISMRF